MSKKIIYKVSLLTIITNVILSVLKLLAGIIAHSQAMLSDAIHSISDVFSTIIVIIGVKLASKKADREHQYGHERYECVAAIILAFILFGIGIKIGISGIKSLFLTSNKIPGILALWAAILSIIVKEGMYWYTIIAAKKVNSLSLKADAWHHRSDALSSIASLIGILGARLGFVKLDSIASIIICLFIFKVAIDIFKDATNKMIDKSCDQKTIKQIKDIVNQNSSVISIDDLKTRLFGNRIYIDLEVAVNPSISILEAHSIAHNIHDEIENNIKEVKHCMIHINPKS